MDYETTQKEISRLKQLYHLRKKEFDTAARNRYLLPWLGFAGVFFFIYSCLSSDDNLIMRIIICLILSGIYCFVNGSVFMWLYSKNSEESERLASIEKSINELYNSTPIFPVESAAEEQPDNTEVYDDGKLPF
ncbi:MAG: hypothetical protein IJA47_03640 [Oscillospiraceae bacterium]|nr:hypothetical protein [Oscillospiraceae bacterium]